jgi:alpha-D-xyloside xylohydrolase
MEQYKAAAANGAPVTRPLFYDFFDDPRAQTVDDQMMMGPDYLVAPVLTKGATERHVYLPPLPVGFVWANVFTGVVHDTTAGGLNITESTPLSGPKFATFPLYHRQSS